MRVCRQQETGVEFKLFIPPTLKISILASYIQTKSYNRAKISLCKWKMTIVYACKVHSNQDCSVKVGPGLLLCLQIVFVCIPEDRQNEKMKYGFRGVFVNYFNKTYGTNKSC